MSKKICIYNIIIAVVMGFLSEIAASYIVTEVLNLFPDLAQKYNSMIGEMVEMGMTALIMIIVISPVIEELVFRFLILRSLNKVMPFIWANIIQALFFGIYHGNVVQGIYGFLLGLLIGYLLKFSGNIFYTILFHMSLNFTGVHIDKVISPEMPEAAQLICALVSVAGIVGLFICLVKNSKDMKCTDGLL